MYAAVVSPSPALSCLLTRSLLRTGRCLAGKNVSTVDDSSSRSAVPATHAYRQFRRGLCSVLPAACQSPVSFQLRTAGLPPHVHLLKSRNGALLANLAVGRSVSSGAEGVTPEVPPPADFIPAPPTPPEFGNAAVQDPVLFGQTLNKLGEPTLSSVGLGGWSPSGLMQHFFDFIHVSTSLPWWASIVAGTVILRLCISPLVIKSQRNMANLRNNMAELNVYQQKVEDARSMGNDMGVNMATQKLMMFMREKDINPLKNFIVPIVQAPVFISVFFALRKMTSLPLSGLLTGGTAWFPDLTVCDPYYALPIITTVTFFAIIELGTDGISPSTTGAVYMRYFMRFIPFVMLPFIYKFPAAILCYWCTSNFVALITVLFLRIPGVRSYFSIPVMLPKSAIPANPGDQLSIVQRAKRDWGDMKSAQKLQNRQQYDEMKFQRAGVGPIVKTYKYDPTKKH